LCIIYLSISITSTIAKHNENEQIKENEMGRACSPYGEKMNSCMVLVGKPEGKRPLGIPRRKDEDDIKMDRLWGPPDLLYNGYRG
jgi:hypothetical protein